MTATGTPVAGSAPPTAPGAARRWGPWLALVAVAVVALVIGLQSGSSPQSLDQRVQHVASEIRCPVCNGETVAQSQAAPAVEIRNQIRADLQAGQSESQVLDSVVAAYGPGYLEKPPASGISLWVWLAPVLAAVAGAAAVVLLLRRWRGQPDTVGEPPDVEEGEAAVPTGHVADGPEAAVGEVGAPDVSVEPSGTPERRRWPRRRRRILGGTGAALVAAGIAWAVVAASGVRVPGEAISGQSPGGVDVTAELQKALTDESSGNVLAAVKDYQTILASDPGQVQALTGEGWLLAGTQQPSLLQRGLTLLALAEKVNPSYAPAHVYRGIALLAEDDYGDSIPEFKWYLSHSPDPKLVGEVKQAEAKAESDLAAQQAASKAVHATQG